MGVSLIHSIPSMTLVNRTGSVSTSGRCGAISAWHIGVMEGGCPVRGRSSNQEGAVA